MTYFLWFSESSNIGFRDSSKCFQSRIYAWNSIEYELFKIVRTVVRVFISLDDLRQICVSWRFRISEMSHNLQHTVT